ncbi:NepR family anti-sigma factor [Microvirga yunnanensis]|nr:NepR family anti-sigma factor [Microvirga sp. HBU67655]
MNPIPDSLTFSQHQVNFILGHSLRSIYQDTLKSPLPEHLRTLVAQLEAKFSS